MRIVARLETEGVIRQVSGSDRLAEFHERLAELLAAEWPDAISHAPAMSALDIARVCAQGATDTALQTGRFERVFDGLARSPRLEIVAFDVPAEWIEELRMWAGHPNNVANDEQPGGARSARRSLPAPPNGTADGTATATAPPARAQGPQRTRLTTTETTDGDG